MNPWFGFYWTGRVMVDFLEEDFIGSFAILFVFDKSANLAINRWIPSAIRMLLVPEARRPNSRADTKFEKTLRSGSSGFGWAVPLKA